MFISCSQIGKRTLVQLGYLLSIFVGRFLSSFFAFYLLRSPFVLLFCFSFNFYLSQNENKNVQSESFCHSKVVSLFSKPAEAQGRAKFSFGSVLIRVWSNCEVSQSESWAETEGKKRLSWVHFLSDCCCVLVLGIRTSIWRRNDNGRNTLCDRILPCHHRLSNRRRSIGRNSVAESINHLPRDQHRYSSTEAASLPPAS